jgi:hypothetical protein
MHTDKTKIKNNLVLIKIKKLSEFICRQFSLIAFILRLNKLKMRQTPILADLHNKPCTSARLGDLRLLYNPDNHPQPQ